MSDYGLTFDAREALVTAGLDVYEEGYLQMRTKGVQPEFRKVRELDVEETKKTKEPKFFEQDVVILHTAGDPLSKAVHPVTEDIIRLFPKQYAEWVERQNGMSANGTNLADMPGFDPRDLPIYEAFGILTVEMLAELNEAMFSRIPKSREMRERAIAFLEKKKGEDAEIRIRMENQELRERLAALEEMMKAEKPRRGRPPKSEHETEDNEAA